MRKIFILSVGLIVASNANTQTASEWTEQRKTQIEYLLQQIAANKVYLEYARDGYKILDKGLNTIRDIKDGDHHLHLGFIDSLKIVNPKIKFSSKVADIISLQGRIMKMIKRSMERIRQAAQFTASEADHCRRVFDKIMSSSVEDLDELFMVITSGQSSMSDDERIARINKIHIGMKDRTQFVSSFSNETGVLAMQRLAEQVELNYSNKINGLPGNR